MRPAFVITNFSVVPMPQHLPEQTLAPASAVGVGRVEQGDAA